MMRGVIAVVLSALVFSGCATKHKILTEHYTQHRIDTTKRQSDSISVRAVHGMRMAEVQAYEDSSYIVFVGSGGVVHFDSIGGVTMHGVSSVRTKQKRHAERIRADTMAYHMDSVKQMVVNGVTDSITVEKKQEVKSKRWDWVWYSVFFIFIMLAIAVIKASYNDEDGVR